MVGPPPTAERRPRGCTSPQPRRRRCRFASDGLTLGPPGFAQEEGFVQSDLPASARGAEPRKPAGAEAFVALQVSQDGTLAGPPGFAQEEFMAFNVGKDGLALGPPGFAQEDVKELEIEPGEQATKRRTK